MDYDLNIHHNPDAQAWAKFFIDTTKHLDRDVFRVEGFMIAWFYNAMMAMHDHLYVTEIVRRQNEAANEIERLREALQPFAKVLKGNWSHQSNEMLMSFGFGEDKRLELTLGDFRNASAALKEKE